MPDYDVILIGGGAASEHCAGERPASGSARRRSRSARQPFPTFSEIYLNAMQQLTKAPTPA